MIDRKRGLARDEAGNAFLMTQRDLQPDHATKRLADQHRPPDTFHIEHGQHVGNEQRQRELLRRRDRAPEDQTAGSALPSASESLSGLVIIARWPAAKCYPAVSSPRRRTSLDDHLHRQPPRNVVATDS